MVNTSLADSRNQAIIAALVLVGLVVVAHGASLWNDFVLADYFQVQPLLGIEPNKWNEFFVELFSDGFVHPLSSPLTKLSIALDFQSGAYQPAAYHATNLFLQVAAVLGSYTLLLRLTNYFKEAGRAISLGAQPLFLPFITCALLAVHPTFSDAVAYISGRAPILTFVFYMVAIHGFLTGFMSNSILRGLAGYFVAYACVLLALLTSCQAMAIPVTLIFVGLLLKPVQNCTWKDWLYERAWEFGALFIVSCALPFLFLLKSTLPVGAGLGLPPLPSSIYFATQLKALFAYYLRIFFVPAGLTIAPSGAIASGWSDPMVWAGAAVVVLTLGAMVKFRNRPFTLLGLFLFLTGMLPLALVVQPEYACATRFYLSAFGLALALADVLQMWLKPTVKLSRPAMGAMALVIVLLIGLANWRDRAYSSNSALLRGALRLDPTNAHTRALLAYLLSISGGVNLERGAIEAERALKEKADLPLAYLARGAYMRWLKNYGQTTADFEKAYSLALEQKLSPEILAAAKSGLAQAIADSDKIPDAVRLKTLAEEALKVFPSKARLYLALGKALLAENKPESAELACRQFDKGRRFDRLDADFNEPYVRAALNTGYPFRFEVAYGAARTASKIMPSANTDLLMARAALETGRIRKGIAMIQQYYSHVPNPSAEAFKVTAALARQSGDMEMEKVYMDRARKADPDVDKHVRLYLSVKPKASIDDDNEGPAKLSK